MIAFDIETVPDEIAIKSHAWESFKEKHECEDDSASLHPAFCQIVSIAAYNTETKDSIASASNSEKDLLEMLCNLIGKNPTTHVILGGHNIKAFDIPVCAIRMMKYGIKIPECMNLSGKKPWEVPHIDTMEIMKFGAGRHISLDAMCLILNVQSPKDGTVKGNSVWDAYKEGRLDEICAYNKKDINAWLKCYNRLKQDGIV